MTDYFEELGKTISDAAEAVGKKTEVFIKVQKIRGKIHGAKRSVEKNYKDLGEIIFCRYSAGESVDEELAIICEEISQINANLAELREELAGCHGCRICPTCEVEVPAEADFCMKCGSPIPDVPPQESEDTVAPEEEANAESPSEVHKEEAPAGEQGENTES